MKVTFLGTGTSQGIPVIACDCPVCKSIDFRDQRLRTSVMIETEDITIVIDTGPDFRQQMLNSRVEKVNAIIYTHEHKDHTAGMDDVRSFNFAMDKDMPLYAEERVIAQLKREFAYAFAEHKYPGVPQVVTHVIDEKPFEIEHIEIIPIRGMHFKLPVLGFRIKDFTYLTDFNSISDQEKEKIKGSKALVVNALQKEPHISHFTIDEAVELAQELACPNTYFTHMSHKLGKHADTVLPENIELAYDGLILSL